MSTLCNARATWAVRGWRLGSPAVYLVLAAREHFQALCSPVSCIWLQMTPPMEQAAWPSYRLFQHRSSVIGVSWNPTCTWPSCNKFIVHHKQQMSLCGGTGGCSRPMTLRTSAGRLLRAKVGVPARAGPMGSPSP